MENPNSNQDDNIVFVISPAGKLNKSFRRLKSDEDTRTAIMNGFVNEALAARRLIRIDRENKTMAFNPEVTNDEITRYAEIRAGQDGSIREAGISPEAISL